ncbi:hypothetical protein LRHMDP2_1562 [Lacticaseibacillus rhamnosus LRHMDP2]|uniref:Uncharacterized protein n=1 Tax=Lacticaseibacillus rhamnosus LRHMDP3 TaxID=1203259 RepID=A0AB33XSV6_LACRH|nr:hypothetical protein LRHMDP3_2115 [Lacticaseibacillus rhamnosus LRHMDP3]EKS51157.1 hypothetical protein LRHMDP2_1562 [Lacticaseibacillus rhamnosus LRHMDP2]
MKVYQNGFGISYMEKTEAVASSKQCHVKMVAIVDSKWLVRLHELSHRAKDHKVIL